MLLCENGKWQSQWQTILSDGVSKWEVVVKMADNFNWWCVKMGSGGQNGKYFSVMVGRNGKQCPRLVTKGKWQSKW